MCPSPSPAPPSAPRLARPGVLHSGSADFESVDDLVEAVGELLQEVSGDSKDDAGIRAVCQRMYNTLRLYVPGTPGVGCGGAGRAASELCPPTPKSVSSPYPQGPSHRARETAKSYWTRPSSYPR